MTKNVEGITTEHVPDSTKIVCPRCNSSLVYLSSTLDDPNDITRDLIFAAADISKGAGTGILGLVALCHTCGNEFVPLWYVFDIGTFNGTTGLTGTDLDSGVINNLAGFFVCILVGTDIGKYVEIASNSVADPTAIVLAFNVNNDADGIFMVTNIEPIGLTKIVA
ncbi:hypothetical protein LCGC14_1413240 [marine sediment metagenome]|uniref:Uncharacterized protein n=1 Tax=marine sediment metagenome TaxID=412755 RepID=A0A0F9KEN6_9ZZZZ